MRALLSGLSAVRDVGVGCGAGGIPGWRGCPTTAAQAATAVAVSTGALRQLPPAARQAVLTAKAITSWAAAAMDCAACRAAGCDRTAAAVVVGVVVEVDVPRRLQRDVNGWAVWAAEAVGEHVADVTALADRRAEAPAVVTAALAEGGVIDGWLTAELPARLTVLRDILAGEVLPAAAATRAVTAAVATLTVLRARCPALVTVLDQDARVASVVWTAVRAGTAAAAAAMTAAAAAAAAPCPCRTRWLA